MDLANPIQSVIPSVQGAVLSVLTRTDEPLVDVASPNSLDRDLHRPG